MQDPINEATDASQIRRAGVDLNGLMSVLSKHLYSTPVVALRELVQNAHDSIPVSYTHLTLPTILLV